MFKSISKLKSLGEKSASIYNAGKDSFNQISNAGTIDEKMIIKDRRAGRIDSTVELCKEIDGMKIDGVEIILKPGAWYRAALVLRGEGLSDKVTGNDAKEENKPLMEVKPTDNSKEAKKTAEVLNKLSKITYEKWKDHPYNKNSFPEMSPQETLHRSSSAQSDFQSFHFPRRPHHFVPGPREF